MLRYTIEDWTSGSMESTVIDEPVGWTQVKLHLGRDNDFHGFTSQVNDGIGTLEYYGNSFFILKAAYEGYGINADVRLKIENRCSDDDPFSTVFHGQFDFSTYKEVRGAMGCYVTMGLHTSMGLMLLESRADQNIALDSLLTIDRENGPLEPYDGLGVGIVLPSKTIKLNDYARYLEIPTYYD